MRDVLADDRQYAYLDPAGTALLAEARQAFRAAGLHENDVIHTGPLVTWFPWAGTKVLRTLELCAKVGGLKVTREEFSIEYHGVDQEAFDAHRQNLAAGGFSEADLAPHCPGELRDRFDEYIDPQLLHTAFLSEIVDLPTCRATASLP
jgi:ATP-dependent Lhr-like helicase